MDWTWLLEPAFPPAELACLVLRDCVNIRFLAGPARHSHQKYPPLSGMHGDTVKSPWGLVSLLSSLLYSLLYSLLHSLLYSPLSSLPPSLYCPAWRDRCHLRRSLMPGPAGPGLGCTSSSGGGPEADAGMNKLRSSGTREDSCA